MTEDRPGLESLAGAYFTEDWDLDAPDVDGVVRWYARENGPAQTTSLAAEIVSLLTTNPSEDVLRNLWVTRYHSYFKPETIGLTYRAWFEHMLQILRDAAS